MTRTRTRLRYRSPLLVAGLVGAGGCGAQTPSPQPPTEATSAPTEPQPRAPAAQEPATEAQAATSADSETVESPAPPTEPPLSELCETMCGAQSSKCSTKQVESCRQNYCYRYGKASGACEPSVRQALRCAQSDPNFLLCANVVPDSCAKKFRAAEDCVATGVAPEPEKDETSIPSGWAKYQSKDARFSVLMPKDVAVRTEGSIKIWSAEATGVTYEIRREPLPNEKRFDQRAFLRIATKLLGACAPKMKLYALIERDDLDMIQFKTTCKDGTRHRGMFYVQGQDYFVLQATWTEGDNPDADTFAFSFVRP